MASKTSAKLNTSEPSEADIAANRARLNYSEASRLAKSWLSGFTFTSTHDSDDRQTDQEDEDAERDLFKHQDQYSETGGIGYHAAQPSTSTSTARPAVTDPTTMFLRKQLLGGRSAGQSSAEGQKHNATAGRLRQQVQRYGNKDDSDEEESRAIVGKGRGTRNEKGVKSNSSQTAARTREPDGTVPADLPAGKPAASANHDSTEMVQSTSPPAPQLKAGKKRGTGSYLDELLASRAAKKQKKNKTRGNNAG
ncbi:hypothetical protein PV04_05987 [Phialophora macrospora]|uniref:Uncharacterized protein n=1 Tax=Phialophora macrospora TaxID=1851006 RepID=A0A0D2FF64_9EURO|nr:hypothetical protein PV04_05987 [Phialophora macrospora]